MTVCEPADLIGWVEAPGPKLVAAALDPERQHADQLDLQAKGRELTLVALTPDAEPSSFGAALRAGYCAAVCRDEPLPRIVATIRAAMEGLTLLPCELARALVTDATGESACGANGLLSDEEAGWLTALAAGLSVCEVARDSGYSERVLYQGALTSDLTSARASRTARRSAPASSKAASSRAERPASTSRADPQGGRRTPGHLASVCGPQGTWAAHGRWSPNPGARSDRAIGGPPSSGPVAAIHCPWPQDRRRSRRDGGVGLSGA